MQGVGEENFFQKVFLPYLLHIYPHFLKFLIQCEGRQPLIRRKEDEKADILPKPTAKQASVMLVPRSISSTLRAMR